VIAELCGGSMEPTGQSTGKRRPGPPIAPLTASLKKRGTDASKRRRLRPDTIRKQAALDAMRYSVAKRFEDLAAPCQRQTG